MVKIKMLKPKEAVKLARQLILESGFMEVSKSPDSFYFKKKGVNFKVRISDHKNTSKQYPDVAFSIVFDYDTISQDVVGRISAANRNYDDLHRNTKRRSSNG